MYTYVALTSLGRGYWVVLVGEPGQTRAEVEEAARAKIASEALATLEAQTETMQGNLFVVSLSAAKRAFYEAWHMYEYAQSVGVPF